MDLGGASLPRAARRGSAATLCPGLICSCPFGALGRTDRVDRTPNGPPKPRRNGLTPTGRHAPNKPPKPRRNRPASKTTHAPKGQNRLAQGRARRRSRRAPPWVNGPPRHVPRPEGAKQMRGKRAIYARNRASKRFIRRNHTGGGRFVAIRFARRSPANRGHPITSGLRWP
jgi:hypothetical protein